MHPDTPDTRQNRGVAETKIRSIRIDDELWNLATKKAKRRRETVTDVIKRALLDYVEGEE